MYMQNQVSVRVKLPRTLDLTIIPGVKKAIQIFPNDPLFEDMWIAYTEHGEENSVIQLMNTHPGIVSCERIPLRTHCE